VTVRRVRPVRAFTEAPRHATAGDETPAEGARSALWAPLAFRLLAIVWAGAIVAAVVDEFAAPSHLTVMFALGLTGLLVGAAFVLTRGAGDAATQTTEEDDEAAEPEPDLLTSLPTLTHFRNRLADEFGRGQRMGRPLAVVLIDVNNLTAVNREYGTSAGDEVLRHVARIVDETKRYNDVAARLGDDEFGVLLLDSGPQGITAFTERLEDRLARESAAADAGGRSVSLWAGICTGASTSQPGMVRPDEVLETALADLNRAKQERERRRRMWLSA